MIRTTPNINTAHLTLRAMRPEDFDRYAEICSMAEGTRSVGDQPRSRPAAWDSFLRIAGHWQMTGFGQWAIVEQLSRDVIGQVGFLYGSRSLGQDFDAYPEASWVLVEAAEDKDHDLEAVAAAHDWFDRIMPGPVVAMVEAQNARGLNVADGLGYRLLREIKQSPAPLLLLRRDRPPGVN